MNQTSSISVRVVTKNRRWLQEQMNPYFFISMKDEANALAILERELGALRDNRRLILADRDKTLVLALVSLPGTLYDTLRRSRDREVSYAMITHSAGPMPEMTHALEIQRFEYDRKSNAEIREGKDVVVPAAIRSRVGNELRRTFPAFDMKEFDTLLRILWLNNESYVRISPVERVGRTLLLMQRVSRSGGLYYGVEETQDKDETRILLGVANPPFHEFFLQVMEVFNRLELAVNRAYCLTISSGTHPWFLATFYVRRRDGGHLSPESEVCAQRAASKSTIRSLSDMRSPDMARGDQRSTKRLSTG